MIHDVEQLRNVILHREYEVAQDIRMAGHALGMSLPMGFAVAYKAGLLDGKQAAKESLKKVYKALTEAHQRIEYLEADKSNLLTLAELINHPAPSVPVEELVKEAEAAVEPAQDDAQHTGDGRSLADIIAENDK